MRVFLTGGTGFVGGAVACQLVEAGHEVRALARRGSRTQTLSELGIEIVEGDLGDAESLQRGAKGCDWVFHVAALYTFWGHSWRDFAETNVEGTRRVIETAWRAGAQRIVYTSSIAVLGTCKDGVADERTPSSLKMMIGDYKCSKFVAEKVAMNLASRGAPVVVVNPAAPVGTADHKPTRTGQIIVDYLNGRMPAYAAARLNVVDVDDVAAGHLLAAEQGRIGERYILGGENITLKQLLDMLSEVSGQPPVRFRVPRAVAMAFAIADCSYGLINRRHMPTATPVTVRMSGRSEHCDSTKAMTELGYRPGPVKDALAKAVRWYRENGYAPATR